jgi:hypothetical protein
VITDQVRDAAATALIFGFFASVWFGWAQEKPPARLRPWLITGSVLALLTAVAGGLLMWRHWSDGTAFDRDTSIRFGIVVGIEFALAGIGAAILAAGRRPELVPVWTALVVGVHLFPVAVLLDYPLIHVTAVLVTLAALAALPLARARRIAVSAATGLLAGCALLVSAWASLVGYLSLD